MDKKTLIKYNNGNQVALCNRCFIIMCYVDCGVQLINEVNECLVREVIDNNISNSVGEIPPVYCDKCNNLLKYTIN